MQDTQKNIAFSPETLELISKIIKRYPEGRQKSALLPILHIAQAENDGWLSSEVMDYVASLLAIQPIEVYEVATFYTMFNMKPVGKCVIEVCQTGPCWLRGSEELVKYFEQRLGIKPGQTTADGRFTLKTVECLAACGNAPVIQVGTEYHENVSTEKAGKLLDQWTAENKCSHSNPYL
ncbi:MAG TPA: NADH-quinone oxidoreductase subunit NuoE [Prolixibacteraceae bacterium]|nr:NADH-quinone oxidoreductase subunit NuoE [Prolixibacteraceae bacterium]